MEQRPASDRIALMDPNAHRIAVVAAIALVSATSGVALGNFAVSKSPSASAMFAGADAVTNETAAFEAFPPEANPDLSPTHYSCTGCDARLHKDVAFVDTFEPFDKPPPPEPAAVTYAPVAGPQPARRLQNDPMTVDTKVGDVSRPRATPGAGVLAPPVLSLPQPEPVNPIL